MKDWFKRLVYDPQLHQDIRGAMRDYPYGMRNTIVTFLMLGFVLGLWFGYFVGIGK